MKKLYFVSNSGHTINMFTYFITEKVSGFTLSIIIISRTVIEGVPASHMDIITPIEGISEEAVKQSAYQIMAVRLNGIPFTQVDKFDEIDDLIKMIVEQTSREGDRDQNGSRAKIANSF